MSGKVEPVSGSGGDIVLFPICNTPVEEVVQKDDTEIKKALEEEIEKEKKENKCEKFLEKWIDIDDGAFIQMSKLEVILSVYKAAPQTSSFLLGLLNTHIPNEQLTRMVSGEYCNKTEFQVLACEYKDKLLNLIIFMLRKFLKDSEFIDDHSLNPQRHAIFVKRIKTIYRILTNYFIGGPNLSEQSVQNTFELYTSKYAHLFNEAQLVTETTSTSVPPTRTGWSFRKAFESPFGLGFRGGSIKKRSRKSKRTRKSKGLYRG
jgi:hypothetical protein